MISLSCPMRSTQNSPTKRSMFRSCRAQADVDGLRTAHRDQHFMVRIVCNTLFSLRIMTDFNSDQRFLEGVCHDRMEAGLCLRTAGDRGADDEDPSVCHHVCSHLSVMASSSSCAVRRNSFSPFNSMITGTEIYAELTYKEKHVSIVEIEGMQERTILINGFSKAS